MKIIFCSNNKNKRREIQKLLPEGYELVSMADMNYTDEIPETADTFEGNALIKAQTIFDKFGLPCFADDSGLEVDALGNKPGVHSARYAGEQKNDHENMDLLLQNMKQMDNRKANFKTVICYIDSAPGSEPKYFVGKVNGIIRRKKVGGNGFGYDPIFEPENQGKTFAEMDMDEKNKYSHRARALRKMMTYLAEKDTSQ